jgi:flagellar protein FlbD
MMIKLTRLNHKEFFLNPDLIKIIEETPDTIIRLANDEHYLVLESAAVVIEAVIAFRVEVLRRANNPPLPPRERNEQDNFQSQ